VFGVAFEVRGNSRFDHAPLLDSKGGLKRGHPNQAVRLAFCPMDGLIHSGGFELVRTEIEH